LPALGRSHPAAKPAQTTIDDEARPGDIADRAAAAEREGEVQDPGGGARCLERATQVRLMSLADASDLDPGPGRVDRRRARPLLPQRLGAVDRATGDEQARGEASQEMPLGAVRDR